MNSSNQDALVYNGWHHERSHPLFTTVMRPAVIGHSRSHGTRLL
ncbi:unnamed protein product [Staurois parvus]|uniref:Uncharacterized protein n=1 Tax=Staurois parvus TaxID=386267 RepID=A0ABN9FDK3_9NEOB|nr:unnamed protein product [Staurois parvus]